MNRIIKQPVGPSATSLQQNEFTRRRKRAGSPQQFSFQNSAAENNYEDDDDDVLSSSDSSEAMEEILWAKMQAPLLRGDLNDRDYSATDDELNGTSAMENEGDGAVILVVENGPFDARKERIRNRLFCDDRGASDENASSACSAASTALQDPETHATAPETPPPASCQSVHSSSDSSRAPLIHEQQQPILLDPPLTARSESQRITPTRRPRISHRSRSDSFPDASQPKPLTFYNPFSCYSPELRSSKHTRRKEIMGMSILTFMHPHRSYYDNDDTNSISQADDGFEQNQHPLSSQLPVRLDDDDSVATENSEEFLEGAARQIRTDLLRAEISELAHEAELAAENGDDSFAAQPCLFRNDMASVQEGRTTGHPKPMRRAQSETSVTMRAAASAVAASYGLGRANKLSVVELRDVNEVFPAFRQFHTHLRTHFFRSNVSQVQLLFDEPPESGANDMNAEGPLAQERLRQLQESPSMATLATPLPDRSGMLMFKNAAAAAALLPMCTNATTATPLPPSDRKRNAEVNDSGSSSSQKKADFLPFNFGKWVESGRGRKDESSGKDESNQSDVVVISSPSQEPSLEGWVGDIVSGHLAAGDPPLIRPKIQIPPGLESAHLSGSAASRRLQPKPQQSNPFRDHSYAEWEYKIETQSSQSEPSTPLRGPMSEAEPVAAPSLPPLDKSHRRSLPPRLEPRALFDSTYFDSNEDDDDDDDDNSEEKARINALVLPPARILGPIRRPIHEIVEQSNNSLVEEEFLYETLNTAKLKPLHKTDSLRTADSVGSDCEGMSRKPTKTGNPDFVTPVHLRTIRGTRTTDFAQAGLLLPSNSLAEESPLRISKHSLFSQDRTPSKHMLDTVLDVSDSLNISGRNDSLSTILLPGFVEQRLPGDEDFRESVSKIERTASTPSPSPVDSPCRSPRRDLFVVKAMTLEDAVALNSPKRRSPSPHRLLKSAMTFPSSATISPPKLFSSLNSVYEDSDDAAAPTTPPCGPSDGQQYRQMIAGTPDSDIVVPIDSTANVPRVSPNRFDLPFKSRASQSLPGSPITAELDFLENVVVKRGDLDQETTLLKANRSEQATLPLDFNLAQRIVVGPETPEVNGNSCGFLTLSPAASHESNSGCSENGSGGKKTSSSRRIRRSTSTGALFDRESSCQHHTGDSIRAAMNIISSLSPKSGQSQRQRALYVRTKENDAFMNNFLYCSKPNDDTDDLIRDAFCAEPCNEANMACGEIGSAYCCTSFIENSFMLGHFFPLGRHGASNRTLLKLSDTGTRAPGRIDPDSWFDIADHRFGCGFDPIWNCTGRLNTNPAANVFFQAPSLKKSSHYRSKHSLQNNLVDETETDPPEQEDEFDEKKWDGVGLYDIDDAIGVSEGSVDRYVQHARHLSFMADESESSRTMTTGMRITNDAVDHSHHALSDKQFQLMYGLSRGSFEAKANNAEHDFATSIHPSERMTREP